MKAKTFIVSAALAMFTFSGASPAYAVQLNGLNEGEVSGGPITVPGEYVYDHEGDHMQPGDNPDLYKGRHDWCTTSPDQPGVDFRGPCARHDMCYDANPNAVPSEKSPGKVECDKRFRSDMHSNCNEKYHGDDDSLKNCHRIADFYADVVESRAGTNGDPKPPVFR